MAVDFSIIRVNTCYKLLKVGSEISTRVLELLGDKEQYEFIAIHEGI